MLGCEDPAQWPHRAGPRQPGPGREARAFAGLQGTRTAAWPRIAAPSDLKQRPAPPAPLKPAPCAGGGTLSPRGLARSLPKGPAANLGDVCHHLLSLLPPPTPPLLPTSGSAPTLPSPSGPRPPARLAPPHSWAPRGLGCLGCCSMGTGGSGRCEFFPFMWVNSKHYIKIFSTRASA